MKTEINVFSIILQALAGLCLFLYAVNLMGDTLKELAGDRMKTFLQRFTKNPATGIVTGTVATTLLDSSSVVIIMVLTLVNASLITSLESFGVIMGANIGTTISSQLIALDIADYAPFLLFVGLLISVIGHNKTRHRIGRTVFAIGLIFFGLWTMDMAVIGRSKDAVRAGLFHLVFNLVCVALGLLFINQFVQSVEWLSGGAPAGRKIANAHVLFNVLGVVVFAPFIPLFHRTLTAVIR